MTGFRITDFGGNDVVAGMVISPSGGGFIVSGSSPADHGRRQVHRQRARSTPPSAPAAGIVSGFGSGGTANIARGPGRRVVLAGGSGFSTAAMLLSGANLVTVSPFDSVATEGKVDPAMFVVRRNEILPTTTRVFFSIGGTAIGRCPPSRAREITRSTS